MKWVFLLTIWSYEEPPQVFVVNSALTGVDCVVLVEAYHASDPTHSHGEPSCELDAAE